MAFALALPVNLRSAEGFDEEDYGVGGRKGDYALMEAINKALDECKADGTTSEISQKWFGEDLIK